MRSRNSRSLSTRILFDLIAIFSAATIASTIVFSLISATIIRSNLNANVARLESYLSGALALPLGYLAEELDHRLWTYTQDMIALVANTAASSEDVVSLRVMDGKGAVLYASPGRRIIGIGGFLERSLELRNGDALVGRVEFVYSDRTASLSILRTVFAILGVLSVSLLATVAGLRVALRSRLGSPLSRLYDVAKSYEAGDYSKRVEGTFYAEFSDLGQVLDETGRKILLQMEELLGLNANLERLVGERTEELERRNRELDLAHARVESYLHSALRASKAKSEFLANMSHELRTPLNAILGFSQILSLEQRLGEAERRQCRIIHEAGSHLMGIIEDLLDTSKIEAKRFDLEIAPFGVSSLVEFVQAVLSPKAEEKDLGLDVVVIEPLPDRLLGDYRRVKQVVLNLAGNAVKYTKEGRVRVSFYYDSGILTVRVEDTGPGIAPDMIDYIFRPFERVRGESEYVEGAGLGLAISKSLAEMMGGTIVVTSETGKGSVFVATMALQATDGKGNGNFIEAGIIAGYEGPRKRILSVDDNPGSLTLLRAYLEPLGFECLEARDGFEALDAAASGVDLVLLDFKMPRLDGLGFIAALRARLGSSAPPIIGLSASIAESESEFIERCDVFIKKPVDIQVLLAKIGPLLGLTWTEKRKIVTADELPPDRACLDSIAAAARRGDYAELENIAEALAKDGRQGFAERLTCLIDRYDEAGIVRLVAAGEGS